MKKLVLFSCALLLLTSCQRSSTETWEDVKTAGRYIEQSFNTLWGKHYDSRQVASESEFLGPEQEDFIALQDEDLHTQFTATDTAICQATGLNSKKDFLPNFTNPKVSLFQSVHFETDDHVLKDKNDILLVDQISKHLKKNPDIYLQIEGHCDKRASAAYNMALGMRRANHVRTLLIKKGIDLNRIYTVSYGKEKPLALGDAQEDFQKNRRSEFKFFSKDKR